MTTFEQAYLECRNALDKIKERVIVVEAQVALLNPPELLQFKVQTLDALKSIDTDIDKTQGKLSIFVDKQREINTTLERKIQEQKTEIKLLAIKVSLIISLSSIVLSVIITNIINKFIG